VAGLVAAKENRKVALGTTRRRRRRVGMREGDLRGRPLLLRLGLLLRGKDDEEDEGEEEKEQWCVEGKRNGSSMALLLW